MNERKILTLDSVLSDKIRKKLMTSIMVKNNEAKSQKLKKDKIRKAMQWLNKTYPKCFDIKNRHPFKLHIELEIFAQLGENAPSRIAIRQAIKWYTHGEQYLKHILHDKFRIDLNGDIIEDQPITDTDKEYATGALAHLLSIRKK